VGSPLRLQLQTEGEGGVKKQGVWNVSHPAFASSLSTTSGKKVVGQGEGGEGGLQSHGGGGVESS